jgi:hypothetical protein
MKFLNLKSLNNARLKAYRRSLQAKIGAYEVCGCGSMGCGHNKIYHKDDHDYINIKIELERVNKEFGNRKRSAHCASINPAEVDLIKKGKCCEH